MANKQPRNLIKDESIEDTTMTGEFIASFNQWTTYENQRKNANHLQNCTKDKKRK